MKIDAVVMKIDTVRIDTLDTDRMGIDTVRTDTTGIDSGNWHSGD